jgi:hypothetical protein
MDFETIIFIELLVQSSLSAVPFTQFSVQLHGCCCMIWASHDSTQGGTSNSSLYLPAATYKSALPFTH